MQIIYEPIWERCTKEEYDKHYSTLTQDQVKIKEYELK